MVADCQLRTNKLYWGEVVEASHPCIGKQYCVKFTGIAFRNVDYLKDNEVKYADEDREAVRQRMINRKDTNPEAVFMLSQIKIYREADNELFNTSK